MNEADLIKLLPPMTEAEIAQSVKEAAFHEAGHLFARSYLAWVGGKEVNEIVSRFDHENKMSS